jgi:hypothetical protein
MRRPAAVIKQYLCGHYHTHELDWPYFDMLGYARCRHCHADMTVPPASVGATHPDSGD